jgi:hypothetical protein
MRVLKNPAFSALAHMNIRVRGRAKVGLFVAFAAAISNLRAADRWRADLTRVRALDKLITERPARAPGAATTPSTSPSAPSGAAPGAPPHPGRRSPRTALPLRARNAGHPHRTTHRQPAEACPGNALKKPSRTPRLFGF